MKNVYFVILCGGNGRRLWPLSRKNRPKPLLAFLHNKSLLAATIDRIMPITQSKEYIGLITTHEQKSLLTKEITDRVGFILTEPIARNTGPAVLYSCLEIEKKDPNALIVFLSADHFIPETEKFCSYLEKAIQQAEIHKKIVTLGLMPTHPATGYGYIQAAGRDVQAGTAYCVQKFHEKPNQNKAEQYLEQGNMFWNLGMFIGPVDTFLQQYEQHAPEMVVCVSTYHQTNQGYEAAPALSIDYAIMEKSKSIMVIPCDFTWNDVGNLETFLSIQQKHDTTQKTKIITIDGKNNIAQTSKKLVSFIGVDNLCVIEDGDVIVVARRDEIEKVSQVQAIVEKGFKELV